MSNWMLQVKREEVKKLKNREKQREERFKKQRMKFDENVLNIDSFLKSHYNKVVDLTKYAYDLQ